MGVAWLQPLDDNGKPKGEPIVMNVVDQYETCNPMGYGNAEPIRGPLTYSLTVESTPEMAAEFCRLMERMDIVERWTRAAADRSPIVVGPDGSLVIQGKG